MLNLTSLRDVLEKYYQIVEFSIDYGSDGNHVRNRENELLAYFNAGYRPFSIYYRGQVKVYCMKRRAPTPIPSPIDPPEPEVDIDDPPPFMGKDIER